MIRSPYQVTFHRILPLIFIHRIPFLSTASMPEKFQSAASESWLNSEKLWGSQADRTVWSNCLKNPEASTGCVGSVLVWPVAVFPAPVDWLWAPHLHGLALICCCAFYISQRSTVTSEQSIQQTTGVYGTLDQIPTSFFDRGNLLGSLWFSFLCIKWVK